MLSIYSEILRLFGEVLAILSITSAPLFSAKTCRLISKDLLDFIGLDFPQQIGGLS